MTQSQEIRDQLLRIYNGDFDQSADRTLEEVTSHISQAIKQAELRGRLSERKAVAFDNYHGHTFSNSTNYKGKFEKFASNNDKRIEHLDNQIKEQADGE